MSGCAARGLALGRSCRSAHSSLTRGYDRSVLATGVLYITDVDDGALQISPNWTFWHFLSILDTNPSEVAHRSATTWCHIQDNVPPPPLSADPGVSEIVAGAAKDMWVSLLLNCCWDIVHWSLPFTNSPTTGSRSSRAGCRKQSLSQW